MLRSLDWQLITDVSVQSISPIFEDLEDGTAGFRNVGNKLPTYAA